MATDTTGANGQSANDGGNDEATPQIQVLGQYVRDLSFENPNAPKSLRTSNESPNLELEVNVNARPLEDDIYQSSIEFHAKATGQSGTLYQMELIYSGAFKLQNVPADMLQPVLLINCPSLIFPFVRRLIADITREGGFPPLMLDPIDFAGLFAQKQSKASGEDQLETVEDPSGGSS